ncbi:MAG: bifunctional DNA-formamidopyrimidine glycosylase/DNA-(apurinic or apyrimidinic site) lyase [Myxococcota bacterium]
MPELPEVETVRRTVLPRVQGLRIASARVRDGRLRSAVNKKVLARLTEGRAILDVRRRAKYLLFDLEGGGVLLVHLGMTGRLRFVKATEPFAKHDHVVFALSNGLEMRFNDARRFGMVEAFAKADEPEHKSLMHLGIEPLSHELTPERFAELARGSKKPIKSFLMDGTKVVGVGNIYACEALHLARIHPLKAAGKLDRAKWERLTREVRATLERAIVEGGTTLRDFVDAEGVTGSYATRLVCYGREGEPCDCGRGRIRRMVTAGRSTFYCGSCQR